MRKLISLSIASLLVVGTLAAEVPTPDNPTSSDGQWRWQGPDGVTLPFTDDEEVLEFLRTAKITKSKVLTSGSNRPLKVRLERDGVQANAIFRIVDLKKEWTTIYGKTYRDFRDSCFYECAAYEMSRMLGLDTVPPCVIRSVHGQEGTMQLWVENAETMKDRLEEDSALASKRHWASEQQRHWVRQDQMMRVFDALIDNFDRNTGNILFDAGGKLWLIDHTRSFTVSTNVDLDIVWCERYMWEKMKALDKAQLSDRLGPKVETVRILALLERRDKIIEHIQALIDERGEGAVLFDADPRVAADDRQN